MHRPPLGWPHLAAYALGRASPPPDSSCSVAVLAVACLTPLAEVAFLAAQMAVKTLLRPVIKGPRLKAPPNAKLPHAVAALIPTRAGAARASAEASLQVGPVIGLIKAGPTGPTRSPWDLAAAAVTLETVVALVELARPVPTPIALLVADRPGLARPAFLALDSGRTDRQKGRCDDPARKGAPNAETARPSAGRPSLRRGPRRASQPEGRGLKTGTTAGEVGPQGRPRAMPDLLAA